MILDKSTFESLYYQCGPRLEAYARKLLRDGHLAKDLVQDVFVRLWVRYQGKSADSWPSILFTMVRNRCIDCLRHLAFKRSLTVPDVDITEQEERLYMRVFEGEKEGTDVKLLTEELSSQILSVTESLPPRCREVFQMSRNEGLKNSEIALRLGISEKAVEKNISRALRAFRKLFHGKD